MKLARNNPFLLFSILLLFGTVSFPSHLQAQQLPTHVNSRPNVILIMADDMGYECLGSYGSASYKTPHLDKLAAEGVRFEHCYSQPLCTPSRVQIMTGKYNFRNYTDFGYLDPKEKTFGNLFKDAGYSTCIAGKWQLNGFYRDKKPGWDNLNRPHVFGFDEYCLWQVSKEKSEGERYAYPLVIQNGEELPRKADQYGPDVFSDYIVDFIGRKKAEPFFVYYPMNLVHDPFVPTPISPDWDNSELRYHQDTSYFKDMVAYTDKLVGKIIDKLDHEGLLENTLIIFTGDNGTHVNIISNMTDGSQIKGDKGKMTDGGTRVPLIAYWKGKSVKGKISKDLVDFTDFLPTLAEAAAISIPADWVADGRSFLPQVIGKPSSSKEYIYMYYKPEWGRFDNGVFVRNQKYKLYDDGRFYDLELDVMEQNSLSESPLEEGALAVKKRFMEVLSKYPTINR